MWLKPSWKFIRGDLRIICAYLFFLTISYGFLKLVGVVLFAVKSNFGILIRCLGLIESTLFFNFRGFFTIFLYPLSNVFPCKLSVLGLNSVKIRIFGGDVECLPLLLGVHLILCNLRCKEDDSYIELTFCMLEYRMHLILFSP